MVEGYPHGLGGWGVSGVFKEGARLQAQYVRLLAPFIFSFVLPLVLLQLLELLGVAWWVAGAPPFLPPGPHHSRSILAPAPVPPPSGRDLLIVLAVSLLLWLLGSLAVASFCKVVEYVYSDQEENPSVTASIFQSLPGAILRMFVTSVWVLLLVLLTIFTVSLPFFLIGLLTNAVIVVILQQLFVSAATLILGFMFLLSQEVAVLEPENYGLAALKRSAKLVEEKLVTALVLFVISLGVGVLVSKGSNWVAMQLAVGKLPPWTVYVLGVVLAVLYLLYMVYMMLVTVVLYFSSKVKYDGDENTLPVDNSYSAVPAEE